MRWILAPFKLLWVVLSTTWANALNGGRLALGSLIAALTMSFFIIGFVLVLLGFDLNAVDVWIAAQGGWLDALGTALFRLVCAIVVLICAAMVAFGSWERIAPQNKRKAKADRIGWGGDDGGIGCRLFCLVWRDGVKV